MQPFPSLTPSQFIDLISSSFEFELVDPPHPDLVKLGRLRIAGVLINEGKEPELLLQNESDPDSFDELLPISHLKVDLTLSVAA